MALNFNKLCLYSIRNINARNFLYEYNSNAPGGFNISDNGANASHNHRAVFGEANSAAMFYILAAKDSRFIIKNKISNNSLTHLHAEDKSQISASMNNQMHRAIFQEMNETYSDNQLFYIYCSDASRLCVIRNVAYKKTTSLQYWNSNSAQSGIYKFDSESYALDHQATFEDILSDDKIPNVQFDFFEQCNCTDNNICLPSSVNFIPEYVMGPGDSASALSVLGVVCVSGLLILW